MINCEKIKSLIDEKGLEQKDIADAVGVSKQMISFILKGLREPSVTVLSRIAKELGVSTADLLIDE